jgi:glucose-1-phosphate thymidylyltransferase
MKGLVLCAGKGTRLRPLTHTGAKHLIPVANKPILFHVIEDLVEAGINDVCLVVSPDYADIAEAVGAGERWNAQITYVVQRDPRGLAHAVTVARDFLAGDSFVMYLGDNLLQHGIADFLRACALDGTAAAFMVYSVPDPRRFGVAEAAPDGTVISVAEKPAQPKSNLAIAGIYLFSPTIHEAINSIQPSARGELEITDALAYLIATGHKVLAFRLKGWWRDTGKPEDVLDANRLLLEHVESDYSPTLLRDNQLGGRVIIGPGCQLTACTIRGPVMLGPDCVLENAFVGPFTAISEHCLLRNCEIENSILMPECEILDVPGRIGGSLLGRHVTIQGSTGRPEIHRLILGDESQVVL